MGNVFLYVNKPSPVEKELRTWKIKCIFQIHVVFKLIIVVPIFYELVFCYLVS